MERMKSNNSTSSFVLLFIFFLIAIAFMLFFLHLLSDQKEDYSDNNDTTTISNTTKTTTTTTTEVVPEIIKFNTSLSSVLEDVELKAKYNEEVTYKNAIFNFKCATYDEADDVCTAGSALMTIDDITYTLYTFASNLYDYSNRPNDYYIMVQEDYVILSMNKAGIEPGVMKIYNKKGKNIKDIKNYISGYLKEDKIINMQYPILDEKELTLYYCNKNSVYKTTIDLENEFEPISDEKQEEVTCY